CPVLRRYRATRRRDRPSDRPRYKRIRPRATAQTERHHAGSARAPNRPRAEAAPAPRYPARWASERRRPARAPGQRVANPFSEARLLHRDQIKLAERLLIKEG